MSNNGPKFRPIGTYNPPPHHSDEPWYNRPQDEVPEMDMEAYAEATYHFTLAAFEALLAKHGLKKLLKDMSRDSALAILNYDCTETHINER